MIDACATAIDQMLCPDLAIRLYTSVQFGGLLFCDCSVPFRKENFYASFYCNCCQQLMPTAAEFSLPKLGPCL